MDQETLTSISGLKPDIEALPLPDLLRHTHVRGLYSRIEELTSNYQNASNKAMSALQQVNQISEGRSELSEKVLRLEMELAASKAENLRLKEYVFILTRLYTN